MSSQPSVPQPNEVKPSAADICQVLGNILANGVDVHRCLAAKALGRIGDSGAVQPLIAALLDEDEDVRTDAAEALSNIVDPQSATQLLENLLGDPCTEVKLAAIDTLAALGETAVIPWLRRMVKGRDEEIAWDEEEFYSSGWDDWVDIQVRAVQALARLNASEAVPDILAAIAEEDGQDMTEAAFKALGQMEGPGIAALTGFLDKTSVRVRRRAAAVLAGLDHDEAIAPLDRAFADPAPIVRAATLRARAAHAPDDPRLARLLDDPDPLVRAEAVALVGNKYPENLLHLLRDPSVKVQTAALTALPQCPHIAITEEAFHLLRDLTMADETGPAAAQAYAELAPDAALDDLILLLNDGALTPEHRLGALHGLATIGNDSAVDALISVIDDETRAIRLETMSALARMARNAPIWPNPAGDALLSALQGHYTPIGETEPDTKPEPASPPKLELVKTDTIVETRPSASTAASPPTSTMEAILADIPEAREVLDMPEEGALLTPMDMERLALAKQTKRKKRIALTPNVVLHEDIRRFAARVLGDVHQIDVAAALADGLKANDGEVRTAAADSLARIGAHLRPLPDSIAKTVIAAMTTADRDMKLPLIRILAACGKDTVVETVTGYLNDTDSFLRVEAVRALAILGGIGAEIGVLLNDADPAVRLCAAEAIAGTGQDNAVAPLVEFAFTYEGYHGRATARLLRDLDADRASDLFRAALDDAAKKRVWSVAIEALEELHCRPNSRQLV